MVKKLFALLLLCGSLAANDWRLKEEFLSPAREEYDCHSSCIIETSPGHLCAAWKAKSGQGFSNRDLKGGSFGAWVSLYDGASWSEAIEVAHSEDAIVWTPILCKLSSQEILLFYRIGPSPRQVVSYLMRSFDGGKTWSDAEILPAGIIGPTKCHPLVLGRKIISPSSVEVGSPLSQDKAAACWIEISEDAGKTWSKVGPIQIPGRKFGVIEPSLFVDRQGNLRMFCRDRANCIGEQGWVQTAVSSDGGWHWSSLEPLSLPNPDSGIDTASLSNGDVLLAYNHSATDRYPLALAISSDDGATWSPPAILENNSGEFPSVIRTSDGLVHVIYASAKPGHQQRSIKHVVIDPALVATTTTTTTTGASR
jgi:predicted neuraminidase